MYKFTNAMLIAIFILINEQSHKNLIKCSLIDINKIHIIFLNIFFTQKLEDQMLNEQRSAFIVSKYSWYWNATVIQLFIKTNFVIHFDNIKMKLQSLPRYQFIWHYVTSMYHISLDFLHKHFINSIVEFYNASDGYRHRHE